MSIASALASGRRAAEARMTARVTVHRKTGTATPAANGLLVPDWESVYVDLPCRISGAAANTSPYRTLNVGGATVEVSARIAHFPHDTTDLRDGDLIEVTDGEQVGSVWRLIEADPADQQTARRVPVIATERPEEWS